MVRGTEEVRLAEAERKLLRPLRRDLRSEKIVGLLARKAEAKQ